MQQVSNRNSLGAYILTQNLYATQPWIRDRIRFGQVSTNDIIDITRHTNIKIHFECLS